MRPHEKASICSSIVKTLFKRNAFSDLSSVYLAGTKATGANVHRSSGTINYCLNLADVRLPGSVGLTVGVRNVVTEGNALTANTALCHFDTS